MRIIKIWNIPEDNRSHLANLKNALHMRFEAELDLHMDRENTLILYPLERQQYARDCIIYVEVELNRPIANELRRTLARIVIEVLKDIYHDEKVACRVSQYNSNISQTPHYYNDFELAYTSK